MKITRTAKELRSQSPSHHHQTWRTLRNAILCAELYEALRGGEKVVTVMESAERGETHDVYKIEIEIQDTKNLLAHTLMKDLVVQPKDEEYPTKINTIPYLGESDDAM